MLEFIESPAFSNRLVTLARDRADEVLQTIQNDLIENPARGVVVQGTSGARKARAADPARGKGKRGGFRYLYYYIEKDGQIFLLMLFNKNEQSDLSLEQKKILRAAIFALKE